MSETELGVGGRPQNPRSRSRSKTSDLDALRPLTEESARRASIDVNATLRDLILAGQLRPGTELTQVDVARRLEVSRTPVREALRMLRQEGLVSGEPNQRCRVVGFTAELIDAVYAERILVEPLAASITTRLAKPEDVDAVEAALQEMKSPEAHADFQLWQQPHQRFHSLLTSRAAEALRTSVADRMVQTQRYRTLLKARHPPGWWLRGEVEHGEIAAAFRSRVPEAVVRALATHLARSALEVLADVAPHFEPVSVRSALAMVMGSLTSQVDLGAARRHERATV